MTPNQSNYSLLFCRLLILSTVFLGVNAVPVSANQDDYERPRYTVQRLTDEIAIDGSLDESVWEGAESIALRYETEPANNAKPAVKTIVKLLYDDDALYIAFIAHDPRPEEIRMRYRDQDSAWDDDYVGISLDTFNDLRRAYKFAATPLGVQIHRITDAVRDNNNVSWNAIWESAGVITDFGYTVEMAIPLNQLRFQPGSGTQIWGFNAYRHYPRSRDYYFGLAPDIRGSNSEIAYYAQLEGFDTVQPGRNVELIPTFTSSTSRTRLPRPSDDYSEANTDAEVGITGRWGITPNMSLLGTVNPDFSQVEADVAQLAVNERFALFFPETRPFFLENNDYFDTLWPMVHTRTIANPDAAAKYTYKKSGHTLGLLTAEDSFTTVLLPGRRSSRSASFDSSSRSIIGRYRYDIGSTSAMGGLLTHREGDGYSSTLAGFDGTIRPSENDEIVAQVVGSTTSYNQTMVDSFGLEEEKAEGYFAYARYSRSTLNYELHASILDTNDDFRADLGFITSVGHRQYEAVGEYKWWGTQEDWFQRLEVGSTVRLDEDQDGGLIRRQLSGRLEYAAWFPLEVELEIHEQVVGFAGVEFNGDRFSFEIEYQPFSNLVFETEIEFGDGIDFRQARQGEEFSLELFATVNIGRHMAGILRYEYETLDIDGQRLFSAHQPQLNLIYTLNRRLLFRGIFQYTLVEQNADLFSSPIADEEKDLFTQLLISYKVNPRTVVFIGYNDGREGTSFEPFRVEDQSLFIKLGYSWSL